MFAEITNDRSIVAPGFKTTFVGIGSSMKFCFFGGLCPLGLVLPFWRLFGLSGAMFGMCQIDTFRIAYRSCILGEVVCEILPCLISHRLPSDSFQKLSYVISSSPEKWENGAINHKHTHQFRHPKAWVRLYNSFPTRDPG